jgi:hypothetical protein
MAIEWRERVHVSIFSVIEETKKEGKNLAGWLGAGVLRRGVAY